MYQHHSKPAKARPEIVGKTIQGVISRPGEDGDVIMLQFDDGTCFELVSARSRRSLQRMARRGNDDRQLTIFSSDGYPANHERSPSLVAA